MSSKTINLADGIVSIINGATWTTAIAAVRKYVPSFTLKELEAGPMVAVVPKSRGITAIGRGANQTDYQIDIGVFRHAADDEAARDLVVDAMVELVEEIEVYFMKRNVVVVAVDFMTVDSASDPIYDSEMLKDSGVFGSVLTLTLREVG